MLVAASAVVGAAVAVIGLSVWRRQLRGTADFEAAKSVLRGMYSYAEALRAVRNPFMFASEFPPRAESEEANTYERRKVRAAYEQRWRRAQESAAALSGPLLEAKVLWGCAIDRSLEEVKQLRNELLAAVENHLLSLDGELNPTKEERAATRELVFGAWSKADAFEKRLAAALEGMEKTLRVHLKR